MIQRYVDPTIKGLVKYKLGEYVLYTDCLASHQWVSVDTPPPYTYHAYNVYINPKLSTGFVASGFFNGTKWEIHEKKESNASDFVTHWTELPPPPKEEE